jgi:hypothetical protein
MTRTDMRYLEKTEDTMLNLLSEIQKLMVYSNGVTVSDNIKGFKSDTAGNLKRIGKELNEILNYAHKQIEEA